MSKGKFLSGLLSGAAVGAAIGLLFAPKKGVDTRKKITETGDNYLQDAKSKFNEMTDNLSHKVESVTAKTKANLSDSKIGQKYNEAKSDLHDKKSY
jgi:gas vesicle protein